MFGQDKFRNFGRHYDKVTKDQSNHEVYRSIRSFVLITGVVNFHKKKERFMDDTTRFSSTQSRIF